MRDKAAETGDDIWQSKSAIKVFPILRAPASLISFIRWKKRNHSKVNERFNPPIVTGWDRETNPREAV